MNFPSLTDSNQIFKIDFVCVMGNFGKPLNFPVVWTPWNPGVVIGTVPRGVYMRDIGGLVATVSEHSVSSGKVLWCPREWRVILCEEAPYLSVDTWLASWPSNASDNCGELTRWDTLARELGELYRPGAAALAFVGGGRRHTELTGVSTHECGVTSKIVRPCEWLVRQSTNVSG